MSAPKITFNSGVQTPESRAPKITFSNGVQNQATAPVIGAATPARQTSAGNIVTLPVLDDIKQDIRETVASELPTLVTSNVQSINDQISALKQEKAANTGNRLQTGLTVAQSQAKAKEYDSRIAELENRKVGIQSEYANLQNQQKQQNQRDLSTIKSELEAAKAAEKKALAAANQYITDNEGWLDMKDPAELQALKAAATAATKAREELEKEYNNHTDSFEDQFGDYSGVEKAAMGIIGSPLYAMDVIGQTAKSALTGDNTMDMDTLAMQNYRKTQQLKSSATENLSGAGKFLADTGISIAQNLYGLPMNVIAPGGSLAVMGADAAASKMMDVGDSGGSATSALVRGGISGGIEALTEKLPLDSLADLVKTGGKTVVKNLLKQGGVEATEEGLSYAMNYIADKAAQDPEAKWDWAEFANSVASGGLSGLFFGLGGTAVNRVNNTITAMPGSGLEGAATVDQGRFTLPTMEQQNQKLNIDNVVSGQYNNLDKGGTNNGTQLHGTFGEGIRAGQGRATSDFGVQNIAEQNRQGNLRNSGIVLLSPKSQRTLNQRGVVNVELHNSSADNAAFSSALDAARNADTRNGWAVTPKSVEELSSTRTFMDTNGTTGFAIAQDGDIEAVFANKTAGAPKGVTKSTIPQAIANGGTKLDCYGDNLVNIYKDYGFIPVARTAFNPEYANEGWTADKGNPDIYFMMHNGDSADAVIENYGNYKAWSKAELDALPVMEYDDAYAYRDSLMQGKQGVPGQNKTASTGETGDYYFDASDTNDSWRDRMYTENGVTYIQSQDKQRMYVVPKQSEIQYEMRDDGTVVLKDDVVSNLSHKDYRDFAKAYSALNLVSNFSDDRMNIANAKPVIVKSTGNDVVVTQTGINDFAKKLRGKGIKNRDNVSSVLLLDKLIENSTPVASSGNNHTSTGNPFTYYKSKLEVGGRTYDVTLHIKNVPGRDQYYYHALDKVDIRPEAQKNVAPVYGSPANSATYQTETETTFSDPSIFDNSSGVNRNSAQTSQNDASNKRFAMSADGLVDEVVSGDYGENTVGSAQARFPYQEAPSQSVADNLFTEQEMQDHDLESRHQVFTNAHGRADAAMLLDYDYEGEVERLKTDEWGPVENVEGHKILENLVEQARKSNTKEAWDKVKEWKKLYDQKGGTEAGQTLQSRAQFANSAATLTAEAADFLDSDKAKKMPEQKKQQIRDSVATQSEALENIPEGDTAGLIDLIKRSSEIRRTTGLFSKKTSKQMDWALNYIADNVSDGEAFLRGVAADQIRSIPLDYSKTSFTEKAKSLRVQFMLSKISTVMRNLVSNGIFDPLESLANNTGIVADLLMSKATGQRTTAFEKSWASKAKRYGSLEGALKSFVEVGLDADSAGSKYEGTGGRTFKMTGNFFERFLSTWAKFQNYTLTTTDEFQKGGIRAEAQENIDKLKRSGKLDADSLSDWADETAKQRTFQNDSIPANMMVQARDALNVAHLGDIGLGDILVPFARVPGNLAAQGANYSPIGMINGLRQTVEVMVDSKNGNYSAEKQAQAARNFGRGLTGTGLLAAFTALALKGVIDVAGDDDEDKEALERAQGRTGTQWNLSATLRLLNGGDPAWRDGDMLMSIGFLDPINSIMAAGALLADEYKEDGSISAGDVMKASLGSIWQSVLDLPAMSSINDLMTTYEYAEGDTTSDKLTNTILDYGGGELESFVVPNFMRGIATGLDDTVRNRYGGESIKETTADGIKSGLPGLRETLPASLDPFGREKTQTGNTALNILNNNLLPGALTRYKETEVESTLNRVYEATENAAVYPDKKAPNSISVDNQKIQLDQEQKDEFMTTAGAAALEIMLDLIDSENFQMMNEETQGQYLAVANEYARAMAKAEVTDGKYELTGTNKKIAAAEDAGMPAADYIMYKLNSAAYNEDGENALTIGENAKAIQNSGMSEKEQTMYWLVTYPEWSEKAEEKGVDIENYIQLQVSTYGLTGDKDKNGNTISGSKKEKVLKAINAINTSTAQKDAMYYAMGYSEKDLKNAPWH